VREPPRGKNSLVKATRKKRGLKSESGTPGKLAHGLVWKAFRRERDPEDQRTAESFPRKKFASYIRLRGKFKIIKLVPFWPSVKGVPSSRRRPGEKPLQKSQRRKLAVKSIEF
jgi:hypothetical protein